MGVDLYWLPLGAGDALPIVRWHGKAFESVAARLDGRRPQSLVHAALVVGVDDHRYAIEMAPAWGGGRGDRGVVGVGPVGLRWLGRSRYFRYEIRRWRDGVIPDLAHAIDGPRRVATDVATAERILSLVPDAPRATWGRDEQRTGDMWNSNSLVAWLLARAGVDERRLSLPHSCRAPGWTAGLVVAGREITSRSR